MHPPCDFASQSSSRCSSGNLTASPQVHVDADVLARDEPSLVGGEVDDHVGNVHRVADAPREVLRGIRAVVGFERRVYPSGRNRVDADASGEAGGERVRERGDAALGGGVTLALRLAHPVARGRDVDYGRALGETVLEQLREIERRNDADCLCVGELLVRAFVDSLEKRHRVVDEDIDLSALCDDIAGEPIKRRLVRKVADEPRPLLHIDYVNYRAFAREALGDALANALRPASDDDNLVFEVHYW